MIDTKKIVLDNGLRVILAPMPQSVAATVFVLVEAGSEYEEKRTNGISHFMEHLMFKGTKNRPKPGTISHELDALGAQYNAFTGQEYTCYYAKVEARKFSQIFEIVSDLYLNPIFNPEEIDKERGVVIEELNMYEDTPMRKVQDLYNSLLYGDQPAGWDIGGSKEVIKVLKREDFVEYRERAYVAPATAVVIAGAFDEGKAIDMAKNIFGGLAKLPKAERAKVKESQSKPELLLRFKESDQTHIALGTRAFDLFDERRYALHVLSDILGGGMSSRLWHRLREERGAAYYVRAGADLSLDRGGLQVAAGIDNTRAAEVVGVIVEEFRNLRDVEVPEAELRKAKDHMIGGMLIGLETSDDVANFYGEQEILTGKLKTPQEIVDRIEHVTAEEIQKVAKFCFEDEKLNLAVIGPVKGEADLALKLKI